LEFHGAERCIGEHAIGELQRDAFGGVFDDMSSDLLDDNVEITFDHVKIINN
jgi:hypothetical protein